MLGTNNSDRKVSQNIRGHPGSNQGPLDLQSNALPLSYIPTVGLRDTLTIIKHKNTQGWSKVGLELQALSSYHGLAYTKDFNKTHTDICESGSWTCVFNLACEKYCQKWDLNPRPHSWTRTLYPKLSEGNKPWVWRLRPLGHPDMRVWWIRLWKFIKLNGTVHILCDALRG